MWYRVPVMKGSLKGRSLLTLADITSEELITLLDRADRVKTDSAAGKRPQRLSGYSIALIFEKRSTRTRCAFETAFGEEGGHVVFLSPQDIHLGVKETVEDTARVLGRMFDCIEFRGFAQKTVEVLAETSGVPVYNGLTDEYHPTQILADLMTVREHFGTLSGKHIAYIGDGRNNVSNTLLIGCALAGVSCTIVCPPELQPDEALLARARELGSSLSADLRIEHDPVAGVRGVDVVYTDVWVSMGEESQASDRLALLEPYRVTSSLLSNAAAHAIFLHCLPAVKGNEVTEQVFEGPQSRVFDQAENRKHTIRALILETLGL